MIKQQLTRIWQRTIWSWNGVAHVAKTEGSFAQWLVANAISIALTFVVPMSGAEQAIIIMGGILVLAAECINTAVERVVDDISTEIRDAAKHAKDAASAAVALTAVAVGAAWLVVLLT